MAEIQIVNIMQLKPGYKGNNQLLYYSNQAPVIPAATSPSECCGNQAPSDEE